MRRGGPFVVSLRRMPLLDMLSRLAVVVDGTCGLASRRRGPRKQSRGGTALYVREEGACAERAPQLGSLLLDPGLYSAEGSSTSTSSTAGD